MRPEAGTLRQPLAFLLVGGLNTMLTGALFLGLASVWPIALAYTAAFLVGVGFAGMVTPRFVFRVKPDNAKRSRYVALYLLVYAAGLVMVYVLHERLHLGSPTAAVITFVTTASLSYVGARRLFAPRRMQARGRPASDATGGELSL